MDDKSVKGAQQFPGAGSKDVVFVSRQPIYTRSIKLFAYELLYRQDVIEHALLANAEKAAAQVFLNTFLDVGLEPLVGDSLAFINIKRTFILQDYCKALPKERVVLEISREVEPDERVIRSLTSLSELGYKLALHDLDYSEQNRPLWDLANYISLNFERLSHDEIAKQLSLLKQFKAKTIARNVATHEEFESAREMEFEYFRGSCFNKPKLSAPTRVPINRLSTLQLVVKLQEPELTTTELERIIRQDLAISYKLLQYTNSASLSLPRTVESIKHAIQMVGTQRIRAWASLLLLTKLDDKPAELLITALVRAKMAESLAVALGVKNPDAYYMVGLFSAVDALLNVSMPEAIQLLPFSKAVGEALLSHEGLMGSVLSCVLAYENGNWNDVHRDDLDAATIRQCYLDALSAARNMPRITK